VNDASNATKIGSSTTKCDSNVTNCDGSTIKMYLGGGRAIGHWMYSVERNRGAIRKVAANRT
jgi:hypothetical protein